MLHRRTALFLSVALAVTASACVAGRPTPSASPDRGVTITAREIDRSGARTAWDAIRLTVKHVNLQTATSGKPRRILRRGQSSIVLRDEIRVFVDDVRIIDVAVLQQIAASDIATIRVMSGVDATTRYGTNSGDGVILISTRSGA